MAGLYEIWRDPTRDEDDPDRFRWTCTVLTTERRGLPRPHPRPDAADGRAATAGDDWLDPHRRRPTDELLGLLVPAAPGRLEAYPVATAGQQRAQQRPRAVEPLPDRATDAADDEATVRDRSPRRTATRRLRTRPVAGSPIATLLLSHGAGGGIDAPDLVALARALPAQGVTVVLVEQPWRVAGRKVATAPPTLDAACVAAADALRCARPLVVGGRRAGARSAARTARELGASGCLALSFPLHPPGRPEKTRARRAARRPACRPWWSRASGTRWAGPRSSPPTSSRRPGRRPRRPTTGSRCPSAGAVTQEEALGIIVEATLEWLVREIVGNPSQRVRCPGGRAVQSLTLDRAEPPRWQRDARRLRPRR